MPLEIDDVLTADLGQRIMAAVRALDEDALRADFRAALDAHGVDALIADVLAPTLRHVGELWQEGELSVLHEHPAAGIVRSVVGESPEAAAQRGRRRVVLCCTPGELHDLPSYLFAAMLAQRGLAGVVLGANTPWAAMSAGVRMTEADACVISAMRPTSFAARGPSVRMIARSAPVFLAGPGAIALPGVAVLPHDWRAAADLVRAQVADHGHERTRPA